MIKDLSLSLKIRKIINQEVDKLEILLPKLMKFVKSEARRSHRRRRK